MKCLSILRYLSENLEDLPLSVTTRFVVTHDVPVLLIRVLEDKMWVRANGEERGKQVFQGCDWTVRD